MQHFKFLFPHRHPVAIVQPARRGNPLGRRKTKHARLILHAINPELIGQMRPFHRQPKLGGQLGHPAGMVQMAMGNQQAFQRQPVFFHLGQQAGHIATGVYQRGAVGAFTPDQGTVLLVSGNRDDKNFHGERPQVGDRRAKDNAAGAAWNHPARC